MSFSIQSVHFPMGGGPLPPAQEAELTKLVEALSAFLATHPIDVAGIPWSERPAVYSEWLRAALAEIAGSDPGALGGWDVDTTPIPSIANPDRKPDDPKWLPIDGASFRATRRKEPGKDVGETYVSIVRDLGYEAVAPELLREATANDDFDRRAELLAQRSGEERAFGEFFLDLDRTTTPDGTRGPKVQLLASYLGQRVLVRAEEAGFGGTPCFALSETEQWRQDACGLAGVLQRLLLCHFPELAWGERDRVEAAFERFATGALRVFGTHGVPDGISYLSFCELALVLVDLGVQTEFWGPFVPLFARTAELYVNAYHACGGPRTFAAYCIANNPSGARTQGAKALAANRAAWCSVEDVRYAFGRIVHAALYDEVLRGPVTPFALADHGCPASHAKDLGPCARSIEEGSNDREWRGQLAV
ncbi:MAG: hypothetical protein R3F49_18435 [Planctomycetota bacterium]